MKQTLYILKKQRICLKLFTYLLGFFQPATVFCDNGRYQDSFLYVVNVVNFLVIFDVIIVRRIKLSFFLERNVKLVTPRCVCDAASFELRCHKFFFCFVFYRIARPWLQCSTGSSCSIALWPCLCVYSFAV